MKHLKERKKTRAKVNDDAAVTQLLSLIQHPNEFDNVQICRLYNNWASENNHETISPSTVGVWRRKKSAEMITSTNVNSVFGVKFIRQAKNLMPSI